MASDQVKALMAPIAGLRYDLASNLIGDMETPNCRNTTVKDGEVVGRNGSGELGDNLPLSGACIGGDFFEMFSGDKELIVGTIYDLYTYNATTEKWEVITPSTNLDGCDTGWTAGTGCVVAHDTTDKLISTASLKITVSSQRSDGDLMAYKDISSADISAETSIGFWIKSSVALAANALEIVVSESNHAAGEKTGNYTECLTEALAADTWKFIRVAKTLTTFNAVISVSVFANSTVPAATVIRVDDIRAFTELTGDGDDDLTSTVIRDVNQSDVWLILSNGVDPLLKYTGSGSADNLITSFPAGVTALTAKQVIAFKNHIHLFHPIENGNPYPTRVRWGNSAAPADFLNGNASYQDMSGSDSHKRAVRLGADLLIVVRSNSIWRGYATGGSDIFAYEAAVPGLGSPCGRTVVSVQGRVIFLGWDDIYSFDGASYEPIGSTVRSEILRIFNIANSGKAFGFVIGEDNEYWLCFPTGGDSYAYDAFVYNYETRKWVGRHEFANGFQSGVWFQRQTALTIGDLTGTIGQQSWKFGDMVGAVGAPSPVLLDSSGYVLKTDKLYVDDVDTAVDSWVSTKDFMLTTLASKQLIKHLELYVGGNGTLTVHYSIDMGKTWTSLGDITINDYAIATVYPLVNCDTIRFRFRNANSGERFRLREYRIYWTPGGGRMS